MERLTTGMQHRPAMYTVTIKPLIVIHRSIALSAVCVHSTYHTPNKEIVIDDVESANVCIVRS